MRPGKTMVPWMSREKMVRWWTTRVVFQQESLGLGVIFFEADDFSDDLGLGAWSCESAGEVTMNIHMGRAVSIMGYYDIVGTLWISVIFLDRQSFFLPAPLMGWGYFVGCNKLQTGFPFPDFKVAYDGIWPPGRRLAPMVQSDSNGAKPQKALGRKRSTIRPRYSLPGKCPQMKYFAARPWNLASWWQDHYSFQGKNQQERSKSWVAVHRRSTRRRLRLGKMICGMDSKYMSPQFGLAHLYYKVYITWLIYYILHTNRILISTFVVRFMAFRSHTFHETSWFRNCFTTCGATGFCDEPSGTADCTYNFVPWAA